MNQTTKLVSVYGAGPAGLMAADVLSHKGIAVALHDHMARPARKFLLAGRGGLNLTHSEPLEQLLQRYGDAQVHLEPAIRQLPPDALRAWCHALGIETFVGTSGRVFPKTLKASPLLRVWLRQLAERGVTFHPRSPWPGFSAKPAILAFGGATWPQLGSNGKWIAAFEQAGIRVAPFVPSNGRQLVHWTEHFASKCAGKPIKNVSVAHAGHLVRGEILISRDGIEGGAIYALSRSLRSDADAVLAIDLRPDLSDETVAERYALRRKKDTLSNFLRKAFGLSDTAISLMHETRAENPKRVPVKLDGTAGLGRAISSAGGVDWDEIDHGYQLRKQPGVFLAGEMLDWDAPTGGYLLQASFATGHAAAQGMIEYLNGS
jgi:uncharacterized flavoprotein (TIGR03862 family)